MKNKLLFGFLMFLGIIAFSSVSKASADTLKYSYVYNSHTYYGVTDFNFSNTAHYDVVGSLARPVGYKDSNGLHVYIKLATSQVEYRDAFGSNANNINVGYLNGDNNQYGRILGNNTTIVSEASFPIFNNYNDAINYAKNLSYNASNIIGGSVPTTYGFVNDSNAKITIDSVKYNYEVTTFSPTFDGSIGYDLVSQFSFTPVSNFNNLKGNIKFLA